MTKTRWYKEAVVYQIYPYSYKDSNNDGMGDIPGIISKLDYIKDLGITAIWFSPLYKTPYKDYGYDISDYRMINPDLGTMEDFDLLVSECHRRDIKVIMDMVINHTSNEHEWFKEAIKDKNSPYRDYYIIREGKRKGNRLLPPTNWQSSFTGSAWARIEGTDEFYLHLFCVEQPDLNWENPKVREEIHDILKYWLDKGVDGFRFDVFNMFSKVYPFKDGPRGGEDYYVDGPRIHEFLNEMSTKVINNYDTYTVGESYKPHYEDKLRYIDEKNNELDSIFDFEHLNSDNYIKFFRHRFRLKHFKDGLFKPQKDNYNRGWNTLVLENHDVNRSNSRFDIDVSKYRYEASTFLPLITYMGFGIPFIYMGQEIGMTKADFNSMDELMDPVSHFVYDLMRKFHFPKSLAFKMVNYGARDHARVPMQWNDGVNAGFNDGAKPWQRMNGNYREINVESDLKSEKSIYRFYQKLIKLKKENRVAIYGETKEYSHDDNKIIAYSRTLEDDRLFIAGNFSGKEVFYKIDDEFKDKLKVLLGNYDKSIIKDNVICFRPYEAIVFEVTK